MSELKLGDEMPRILLINPANRPVEEDAGSVGVTKLVDAMDGSEIVNDAGNDTDEGRPRLNTAGTDCVDKPGDDNDGIATNEDAGIANEDKLTLGVESPTSPPTSPPNSPAEDPTTIDETTGSVGVLESASDELDNLGNEIEEAAPVEGTVAFDSVVETERLLTTEETDTLVTLLDIVL
ncbi:hypothetical protein BDV96DRAFT_586141 [Lophiotrema nucula]|uniref:Uncharacterized protein n=1 Tax=Lophiotrema nucula TaxID=690887 RepID=A0A6A5YQJ8_9PLEO|nr:hypothetical protein BDV96DRAFT_586141 [Lophiotrema nucula]